ncbi:hypothetical protein [Bradyrhizobium prioriisuperbiae]|uniref:hypothetical protein n=1 Tax=Bradyrhizobium prioriisuperbiae TaxID=2854389 RepID=UPI0028E42788|nr:hypothetical protein [Bradyrhizobium prioritasuperba]
MNAVSDVHVETNEQDTRRAELRRQIQRLKTGIPARPDDAWPIEHEDVLLLNSDPMDIGIFGANSRVMRQL